MIEIAGSILNNESAILPLELFQRRRQVRVQDQDQDQQQPQPQPQPQPHKPPVFNSLLIKTLLEIDSVLDTWLRIYEYRGPLGLLNYREMSSTSPTPLLLSVH